MRIPAFLSAVLTLVLTAGTWASALSQDSVCAPEWTVQFNIAHGAGMTDLFLVMDTSATPGWDEGLDQLCPPDTGSSFACLVGGDSLLLVSHTPSSGESPIPFSIAVDTDSADMTLTAGLGDFLLDSASLSWMEDSIMVTANLLLDSVVVLPASLGEGWIEGVLVPSCAILGCTNPEACNYDPAATEDDGSCELPFFCFDCEMNCLCDEDMDGVCDPFEFPGCTDPEACNYAPVYTDEDGSCYYAEGGFDCNGFCLPVENDECGMAQPIGCSEIVTATTVCADTTESDYCDQYNIGEYFHGGLWYTIMGTGDTLRATMCFEETEYDTYLSIYEGDCDDLNCVAGNDDQDEQAFFADPCYDNFLASRVEWESEEGVEYFLHVSGSNAVTPAVGGFDFVLVCDGVEVGACLDSLACNYNPFATFDDGTCDYATCAGCGLASACNFDSTAFINDLTLCDFTCYGCTDLMACNFNPDATIESGLCEYTSCAGCLEPEACNYAPDATIDADNCEYTSCVGCTDAGASNYNPLATQEDGSCTYCDLVLSPPAVAMESCFGAADGVATLAVDSALSDSVYFNLDGPSSLVGELQESLSGLAPGNYVLEVFDGDSTCSAVQTFTVDPAVDVALFAVASSPFCAGGADGSISAFVADTLTVTGFTIDGVESGLDGNVLGLSAGNYFLEVEVLNLSGATCTDTVTVEVIDPPGMTITLDGVEGANPGEENGGASVTVTGGAEPYSFEWTGPSGSSGLEDPDDLLGGNWLLTVTDADGCSDTLTVSIPVGIAEHTGILMSASPNPVRNALRVTFGTHFEGQVLLRDGAGRLVNAVPVLGQSLDWNLSNHPSGVYTLHALDHAGGGAVLRLVIVH